MSDELDIDLDAALAELQDEEEQDSCKNILKLHPEFVAGIVAATTDLLIDDPNQNELEALYVVTNRFLSISGFIHKNDAALSGFFSVYIESYRAFRVYQNDLRKDTPEYVELDFNLLYNEAALSLFDLYLWRSFDPLVRRLLSTAVAAIHQLITMVQATVEDRPAGDVIADITNLMIFSQTIKNYTKGSRRAKNYPYIRWLKKFLNKALSTPDLSFMGSDQELKSVIEQIRKHDKTIVVS